MADKSITLRDFSGGLNTSADPATLAPQFSPDLLNVEVLNSRSIRRRKGFVTEAVVATAPLSALYRWYDDAGPKWLSLTGTSLTGGYSGVNVTVEAEVIATPRAFTASNVAFSGGSALRYMNTQPITATIPASDSVRVRVWGISLSNAIYPLTINALCGTSSQSVVIPATATETIQSHDFTFSGMVATHHALTITATAAFGNTAYLDTINYSITPSSIASVAALSASGLPAFTTHGGSVYFADAYTPIRSYDGSTVTTYTATSIGPAPPAAFLTVKQNRIFAAGRNDNKTLVEYTNVGATSWKNGGSFYPVGRDIGDEITGMEVWRDALWVFHNGHTNAISVQGADTDWVNKSVSDRHGCVAPKSLVPTPNALMFLSADGVRAYGLLPGIASDDGSGFMLVSKDIQPTIARITASAKHKACAEFYDGRYFLSVPLDGSMTNSHTLVYRQGDSNAPGSWTLYDYGVECMVRTRGDEDGLFGGTTTGSIIRMETGGTDNGDPIAMRYVIPPIPSPKSGGGFASLKHFNRLYLSADASALQALTVTPSGDDAPGSAFTVDVTATTDTAPIRRPVRARGRSLSLAFDSSGSEQDITISEVTLTYSEKMR